MGRPFNCFALTTPRISHLVLADVPHWAKLSKLATRCIDTNRPLVPCILRQGEVEEKCFPGNDTDLELTFFGGEEHHWSSRMPRHVGTNLRPSIWQVIAGFERLRCQLLECTQTQSWQPSANPRYESKWTNETPCTSLKSSRVVCGISTHFKWCNSNPLLIHWF